MEEERARAESYRDIWMESSKQSKVTIDKLFERVKALTERSGTLSAADWAELKVMSDSELRKWVTIGERMEKNPTVNNPAEQARRWETENRPSLPAEGHAQ